MPIEIIKILSAEGAVPSEVKRDGVSMSLVEALDHELETAFRKGAAQQKTVER